MTKWKRAFEFAVAGVLFASIASTGLAQSAADAIAARSAAMKAIGKSSGVIANAMKAETPDFAAANEAAKTINTAFVAFPGHFGPGTGPDSGVTTKAKAEIWTDMAGFKAANDKAVAASASLLAATGGTDAAAVNTALMGLRGTCGGCHSAFRN